MKLSLAGRLPRGTESEKLAGTLRPCRKDQACESASKQTTVVLRGGVGAVNVFIVLKAAAAARWTSGLQGGGFLGTALRDQLAGVGAMRHILILPGHICHTRLA